MAAEPIDRSEDQRWPALNSYVEQIAEKMGLGLYRYELVEMAEESVDGFTMDADGIVAAQTTTLHGYLTFRIEINQVFFEKSPAIQRHLIVHELIHVINNQRERIVGSLETCGAFGSREFSLFRTEYNYADEQVTDWLATLIAPSMPLPEWPPC